MSCCERIRQLLEPPEQKYHRIETKFLSLIEPYVQAAIAENKIQKVVFRRDPAHAKLEDRFAQQNLLVIPESGPARVHFSDVYANQSYPGHHDASYYDVEVGGGHINRIARLEHGHLIYVEIQVPTETVSSHDFRAKAQILQKIIAVL